MRLRSRTWLLISVLCLVGAAVFWRLGEQRLSDRLSRQPAVTNPQAIATDPSAQVQSLPSALQRGDTNAVMARRDASAVLERWRLRNTDRSIDELIRDDNALLLRNALIDTAVGTSLPVPEHLRAEAEPGSYIVQARGGVTPAFQQTIEATGAEYVSYLPNNAYLVRATAAQAAELANHPGVRAVVPNEPYFKLWETALLAKAAESEPLEPETRLNVLLLPGTRDVAVERLQTLGAEVLAESKSPFGPLLVVGQAEDSLAAIARIPAVQGIETFRERRLLNDLARRRVGISGDTNAPGSFTNHLGLTGEGILIGINDSGVDSTHPDLEGRVTASGPSVLIDLEGHGTHVAATIIGDGSMSATVSNAPGSSAGADFRGMAPAARLFALPIDLVTGPLISDAYLHETAATNYYFVNSGEDVLISNNSWGYRGAFDYTISSASYDAAVRDALPEVSGSQPILYVFAAGNEGFGTEDGQGGEPNTISAPGTGKNVITVGAIESMRVITNEVVYIDEAGELQTNQVFLIQTDSNTEVSSFSSRGNVEPGIEGRFGRFKPDVVAPGTFIVSARSRDWIDPQAFSAVEVNRITDQRVAPDLINNYSLFVPPDAGEFRIRLLPNFRSPDPFPGLPIYLRYGDLPGTGDFVNSNNLVRVPPDATLRPGDWFYGVGNPTSDEISYDIQTVITVTNDFGNYFEQLKSLNDGLAPHYRYESGTSMATPVVSGVLALFQEYLRRNGEKASPALLKALLVNGARSVDPSYHFNVRDVINLQGWGLVNLTNSLPAVPIGSSNANEHVVLYAHHTGTNALVTGQRRMWNVNIAPHAVDQILKVTLVWTDPPGNPIAAVKLVNDLDLIVRTGSDESVEIYGGNDIPFGSDFNLRHEDFTTLTNDVVNNVENIILRPPLATNYTIEVRARRVNVNAVTEHPNGIAQDFALVVGLEDTSVTNVMTIEPASPEPETHFPLLIAPTNGVALLMQRVGATPPEVGRAPGPADQWTFFVFTNLQIFTPPNVGITNGSNVAFITFSPPNLSRPRTREADIDLYVSTNPQLTNLAPAVLESAFKSTRPGGTEFVFFTNAPLGEVYYIGVKAEDQQAAEFGFVALSSDQPFDEEDEFGNRIVRGLPVNVPIPDGSPDNPQAARIFGLATRSFPVQRVIVTNTVVFDSTGDILADLRHDNTSVVLNNHALDPTGLGGAFTGVYDDSSGGDIGFGNIIGIPTDGPGELTDFIGSDAIGPWILTVVDNALTQVATNVAFSLLIQPQPEDDDFIFATVAANSANYYFVDVPSNATNLIVTITGIDSPLFLGVRRGGLPTFDLFDKGAFISPPGDSLSIGRRDVPPLNPGRYYIGVFNPNPFPVNYGILIEVELDLDAAGDQSYGLSSPIALVDDARVRSIVTVPDDRQIADLKVGLRVRHPRVSDLVFHVTSPQGTRLLLAENRGGPDGTAYGADPNPQTRIFTTFTDNTNLTTTPIKVGVAPFTNSFVTSTSSNRVVFADGFEDAPAGRYESGQRFPRGWTVLSGSATVVRVPPGSTNVHEGSQYLMFTGPGISSIATNLVLTPGKAYRFRLAVGRTGGSQPHSLAVFANGRLVHEVRDPRNPGWYPYSFSFPVTERNNLIEFRAPASAGGLPLALDAIVFEEADRPSNAYYLPEEALEPIVGERAAGDWLLEVTDTRAGPPGGVGDLDWRLEFVYALPFVNAIQLTNNIPYFGDLTGVDISYFYVEVPRCATMSVNTVSGAFATLLLFGDRDGLPVADASQFVDDYGPYLNIEPGGIAQFTLTTNFPAPAPLRPGQRYYLAVRNFQPDLTNNAFGIRVTFDCEDPPLPVVDSLTNGVPREGVIDPGPGLHYYQFEVSSNAIRADFELSGLNGNVDMYIRKAREETGPGDIGFPLPSPSVWDYKADDPDPDVVDVVSIDRTSAPVGLEPGIWYVAIRNGETFPVSYSITATEFYTTIIELTNGVPYTATIAPVDPIAGVTGESFQYYSFLVSSNSVRADFETFTDEGDINLYLRKGLPIPTPFDYHFASLNLDGNEFISVTNTTRPIWLSPGYWFLAVENADITNITYSIQATEFPALITVLTNEIAVTNTIGPGENLDYYSFQVSSNALSAKFEVFDMTGDVQLLVREALPVPTFNQHTYASTNVGLTPEVIELTAFSFPVGLTPGDWYLSVANTSTNANATYVIRATEETAVVIPLTNGVPYNAVIQPGPNLNYYQFEVSSNALIAEFTLTSAGTGDLDLFLRKGPPLPEFANAHYMSTNVGVVDELIRIETNSLPVPLSPGIWYLSVSNNETNEISYEIMATEFGVEQPPDSGTIIDISYNTNNTCITWISLIGTNYHILGKVNALDPTWTVVSPTITATAEETTWCLEPPGPWRFFQVVEGDAPDVPVPTPIPVVRLDGTNVCVVWDSAPGTNYFVQAKAAFNDPVWVTVTPSVTASGPITEICYPIEWGYRFFRVGIGVQEIPVPTPLPPDVVTVDPAIDRVCITWPTQPGLDYLVEGKQTIDDANWTVISEPIRGDGSPQSLCLTGPTEFRYFRVIEGVSVPPGAPPSVAVPNIGYFVDPAFNLCLTWSTLVGAEYFVEAKERFADPAWTVISPILQATGIELSYCQPLGSNWRYFQVRRVNTPPQEMVVIEEIALTTEGPLIMWSGPAGARFQVFYSDSLMGEWQPLGQPVTSLDGQFQFQDDGADIEGVRFYRIERLP